MSELPTCFRPGETDFLESETQDEGSRLQNGREPRVLLDTVRLEFFESEAHSTSKRLNEAQMNPNLGGSASTSDQSLDNCYVYDYGAGRRQLQEQDMPETASSIKEEPSCRAHSASVPGVAEPREKREVGALEEHTGSM